MQFEVDVPILANEKLEITVMDQDSFTGDKSLGSGKVSLRRLCPRINSEVELSVDLTENGVVCGRVVLIAILRAVTRDQLIETIPESAIKVAQGLLRVHKISVNGLKGGDAGLFRGGKQDPYVVLGLDKWSARTDVKDEGGTEATWEGIEDMQTNVSGDILRFKRLNASVFDKNDVGRDELLGEGDASLRGLGSQSSLPDEDLKLVEIRVKIRDKKGRVSGEVRVLASVTETLVKDNLMLDNEAKGGLKEGILEISQIQASNVLVGGLLQRPQPCVELAIGSNWRYSTEINKSAGKSFVWNPSDARTTIAIAQLRRDPIRIKIVDGGKVVGQGSVTGLDLLAKEGKFTVLKCALENQNRPAGTVSLQARFKGDEQAVAMISAISGDKNIPENSADRLNSEIPSGMLKVDVSESLNVYM
jgi:Ca2+-dependent lipid-binding protein